MEICCINKFTSLCKNLFNLLEFLAKAFRCHVHREQHLMESYTNIPYIRPTMYAKRCILLTCENIFLLAGVNASSELSHQINSTVFSLCTFLLVWVLFHHSLRLESSEWRRFLLKSLFKSCLTAGVCKNVLIVEEFIIS